MSEQMIQTWLRQLIGGKRPATKRKLRAFDRWIDHGELLEERQVLSAVTGSEELPVPVEVSAPVIQTMSATAKHQHGHHGKAAPMYPVVTGVWDLTVSISEDQGTPEIRTGTVEISQNKGKVTGNVQLSGLPLFTIKGKLNKTEVLELSGSTKFPVEFSEGNFHGVKGTLTIHFNQNLINFSGSVHRTIFGHDFDAALTATKQV